MSDPRYVSMVMGRSMYIETPEKLASEPGLRNSWEQLELALRRMKLAYFAPCNEADLDFLNDTTSSMKIVMGPNRRGKTTLAMVDLLLDVVPTTADWPIFAKYGVRHRGWRGPKKLAMASYEWRNVRETLVPLLLEWAPSWELRQYHPYSVKAKEINPEHSPQLKLKCGSSVWFYNYEQSQGVFESAKVDRWLWDEQGGKAKFDGADARTKTIGGRHVFSLTPHRVEGRPDTGAAGWLIRDVVRGNMTYGHTVHVTRLAIEEAPDYVLPDKAKRELYVRWVQEPQETNNIKDILEGKARYFGEPQESTGLVYDEVQPDVHFVEPFDVVEAGCTLYRAIDHGTKNPCACLWCAVDEKGFAYLYREYYMTGRSIYENARGIVEAGGGKLKVMDTFQDPVTGQDITRYEEVNGSEVYAKTVLDARSMGSPDMMGRTIGWLWRACGILVQPAGAKQDKHRIPMVKDWLRIDPQRANPITGKTGSPRMFIFNTLRQWRREWQNYVWEEWRTDGDKNPKEKPRASADHLMDSLSFMCQIPPRYLGAPSQAKRRDEHGEEVQEPQTQSNPVTGY